MLVQRLTMVNSFDATGKYVPEGHLGTFDDEKITDTDKHLVDPGELPGDTPMVQIAAIAPTGPNPTVPQQLPPDAVQAPGGGYVVPGKQLVGEVTRRQEERIDQAGLGNPEIEAEVSEALRKIAEKHGISMATLGLGATAPVAPADAILENNNDALVNGTVPQVTADLGTKTDDQLNAMLAAEKDREKPRAGVTNAIQAELDARAEAKKEEQPA
jgi:hypothetical protein